MMPMDEEGSEPLVGAHRALGQRLSGPMFWNPSTDNPPFDGQFTEATAQPPKPVGYGDPTGSTPWAPNTGGGGASSGLPSTSSSPTVNPDEYNALSSQMEQPGVRQQMIDYLSNKAKMRQLASEQYQAQARGVTGAHGMSR